ncbi:unnamed protein product [Ambrosiozyma monospora]|uniref:Unnamed protein product n=1 Tax=Ambrosiozyma monospora TaxID=43982 RepID=A0ACB5TG28_AMBMO|nr:unnamed protein product [Ambrosiozyma monospora]
MRSEFQTYKLNSLPPSLSSLKLSLSVEAGLQYVQLTIYLKYPNHRIVKKGLINLGILDMNQKPIDRIKYSAKSILDLRRLNYDLIAGFYISNFSTGLLINGMPSEGCFLKMSRMRLEKDYRVVIAGNKNESLLKNFKYSNLENPL